MKLSLFIHTSAKEHNIKTNESYVGSGWHDWIFVALCAWLIAGTFIDGWAHNHLARFETFFTPWHAVLYSAMLAIAAYLIMVAIRTHRRGAAWLEALPAGYGLSLYGVFVFFIGGVADMTWHILFGTERNIEALLSPSHLVLVLGATLIVGGPLRAATGRSANTVKGERKNLWPAILSLTYVLCLATFFSQFANPIVHSLADVHGDEAMQDLGITSILLQTAIEMSVVLFLVQRWNVPVGTFALVFGIKNGLSAILADNTLPVIMASILLAALIGLIVDGVYAWLKPSVEQRMRMTLFAFLVPLINLSAYFLVTQLLHGVAWSINLWLGSIVMSGMMSVLLNYLMLAQVKKKSTSSNGTQAWSGEAI